MPVYTVECGKCSKTQEIWRSLAQYDDLPKCCGERTKRIISKTFGIVDIPAYRSMITGEMIEGRAQHRAHLKQHKCIEIGNETDALMKKAKPQEMRIDREKRKRQLAEVVNSKL